MKYRYDSWKICASRTKRKLVFCSEAQPNLRVANRVQTITYPDGEVVRYEYNLGGMLRKMEGQKGTQTFTYINDIRYNRFEQRDAVWYGNGTHVEYSYDTLLRLSRLESWDVQGPMQHVNYNYDRAGNITCIQNSAGMASATGLGGTYSMSYTYDSLYRLQGSTGGLNGMKDYRYWLDMAYEANGRILRKSQLARTFTSTSSDTLMNYAYLYDYGATPVNNRVQSVADTVGTGPAQTFTWDANGNMLTQSTGTLVRTHCWDELNRLQGFSDSKYDACFLYDGSGERFYKFSGMPQSMMVNGQWSTYHSLTDPTLYASPYLVATPKGYTKHYYAESERVASKVGGGGLQDLHSGCVSTVDFAAKKDSSLSHVQHIADCLGIVIMDMAENKLVVLDQPQGTATDPFYEEECYWYHPDHLGSASWVSDKAGKGIQYLYYLPWGEPLADHRLSGYATRYTFSGKERDEETGYSYFGARHYDSDLSLWLSVDPMADKYPGVSPYVYCANNPVRLVDEDGREVWILANDIKTRNEAFNSLQSGTHLLLKMEDDGRIIIVGGGIYNDNDQQLANAINSSSVKCNIDANPNPIYFSGHYMGTEYDSDTKTAVSTNGIFLPGLQKYEKKGAEGSGIMHEITEGFQMGLLAIENKTSIPAAKWHSETNEFINTTIKVYDSPITNQLFPIGHGLATPDPCSMSQKQAEQFKQYQFEKYKPTIHFPIKLFP